MEYTFTDSSNDVTNEVISPPGSGWRLVSCVLTTTDSRHTTVFYWERDVRSKKALAAARALGLKE